MRFDTTTGSNYGLLKISSCHEDSEISLKFKLDTLQNWFPFNQAYTYVLNTDGELELSFQPTKTYNEITGTHYLNTVMWYTECIRKDNQRIADLAAKLKIASPFAPYTASNVEQGMKRVGDLIDALTVKHTQDAVDSTGRKYSRSLEGWALRHLEPGSERVYMQLGEIYSMLNSMRKVVKANGVGRPTEPAVWGTNSSR